MAVLVVEEEVRGLYILRAALIDVRMEDTGYWPFCLEAGGFRRVRIGHSFHSDRRGVWVEVSWLDLKFGF